MTPAEMVVLERRLSAERLAPYRVAAGGNLHLAVRLYEWNATASGAFWTTLGHVEVLLRNAIHDQLTAWSTTRFGEPRWYLDPGQVFTAEARQDITAARRRATRTGRPETPGRVVAELTFGFWRFLLAGRNERALWRTCLYRAFPGQGRRRTVHDAVAELHTLRNRIAHHEPIHDRPLADGLDTALILTGWICSTSAAWVARHSSLRHVLVTRPQSGQGHVS